MAVERYPTQLQATYSELLARARQAELQGLVDKEGSFAAKEVKGQRFWYFRRWHDGRVIERYVGPETPELLKRIDALKAESEDAKAAARGRRELVRMLRANGYPTPDARTGRLLRSLSLAGVFRLRAMLIGTHAFRCYGAMLGVRLPDQAAFTDDIDIAQFETVSIALGDRIDPGFEQALAQAERFAALPSLRNPTGSSKWRTPDQAIEVELLTPNVGPTDEKLRRLPALQAYAQPLRFLDYLIYRSEPAVILHGAGILANVPPPERYACHKLVVSQRRSGPDRDKARKDIAQAAALIETLLEDRPEDLRDAWDDLIGRGPKWRSAATKALRQLPSELRDTFR